MQHEQSGMDLPSLRPGMGSGGDVLHDARLRPGATCYRHDRKCGCVLPTSEKREPDGWHVLRRLQSEDPG